MSESVSISAEDQLPVENSMAHTSAGAILKGAREAVGLHIAALAVALKVPVKKLEALEADRFDLLPDTVFVRALASSVCRTLKIDPNPILAMLPNTTAPRLKIDEAGINVPFRGSDGWSGLMFWGQLSKPFVFAVLALLVGVLVLVYFPAMDRPPEAVVAPMADVAAEFSPLIGPTPTYPANDIAVSIDPPASDSVSVASSTPLPKGSEVIPPVNVPTPDPVKSMIIFKARGSSWVEVVDAKGVVQLRETLSDGEVAGASGAVPLSVIVGRVDNTEVQVRGKPFDMTGLAKSNVARFEVK